MDVAESFLNEFFSPLRTRQRNQLLVVGILILWVLMGIIAHPPNMAVSLVQTLGRLVTNTFQVIFEPWLISDLIRDTIRLVIVIGLLMGQVLMALLRADVLRHMLVIIVPLLLAYRIAVIYLDDLFEQGDEMLAFRYLRSAAFGINPFRIVVKEGAVTPEHQGSPIVRIGGPGLVQVNLENVAVFDTVEGEPHIIGPTVRKPGLAEALGSFERLRHILDLRDQVTHSNEVIVEGRTRDGVPLQIRDVRMQFSVLRAPGQSSSNVYTFDPRAITTLVYGRPGSWTQAMIGLVRGQLQSFIARHTLSEILASVGAPEVEEARTAAIRVNMQAESFTQQLRGRSTPSPLPPADPPPPPGFTPRLEITDMFYDRSPNGFQARAAKRGVQLHWINVGTPTLPTTGSIAEVQQEAWRLSEENEQKRQELAQTEAECRVEELSRMVREIPLITYAEQQEEHDDREEIIAGMISKYLGSLRSARDEFERAGKPVPGKLEVSIRIMSRYLQEHLKNTGQARFLK